MIGVTVCSVYTLGPYTDYTVHRRFYATAAVSLYASSSTVPLLTVRATRGGEPPSRTKLVPANSTREYLLERATGTKGSPLPPPRGPAQHATELHTSTKL